MEGRAEAVGGMYVKIDMPLEGVINFYQALERFERYCKLCRTAENVEQKIIYSANARDDIDAAYQEYLQNVALILAVKSGARPIPMFKEVSTEELKRCFEEQLAALNENAALEYLEALNTIRRCCPENCERHEDAAMEKLKELANKIKESVETLYVKEGLEMTKKQLKEMVEDPEKFRAVFVLPPKPLVEEYRL
ncbi:hypothetical protein [Candidatus Alkanophaga liquidiphilum]|nr:hypothetical protein [Candidatus Alkanophaga liquidiphilum]RLG38337.1 MAG: hypothetical protein DRN91_02965 [Candidatus Alkanophagales archaeon]